MRHASLAAVALLLALAGCGSRELLTPAPGKSMPPAAAGDPKPPTAESLMTADTQARPGRSDEVLRRSQKRQEDRFDLPPPG